MLDFMLDFITCTVVAYTYYELLVEYAVYYGR